MSIVYRTYLHTIMENNKVVFLCLILLLVLVVSNYVKVQEGFKAKKPAPAKKPATATKPAQKAPAKKKKKKSKSANKPLTMKSVKKTISSGAKKVGNALSKTVQKGVQKAAADAKKAAADAKKANIVNKKQSKQLSDMKKNINSLVNNNKIKKGKQGSSLKQYFQKMETLSRETGKKIKTSDALSKQVLEKAIGLDANAKQISNSASTIDAKLANVTKINNSFETNASNYITKISGLSETVNKSVEANKGIQNEINTKVGGIDKQMETIKNNTDTVIQIKNDVDKIMNEFKVNSETMLKTMQLAIDKMNVNQIPAKTQGFQNMNDPVLQASESLKKDMEVAKSLAFTTIDSAYNGDLHLETPWTNSAGIAGTNSTGTNSKEGFVDSTTANSAYVVPVQSDIFNLEKEVLIAFNNFNTKYYDVYQTCLQSKRKIKDRIKNGEKGLTEPDCGTSLKEVYDAKTELVGKITTLNEAIVEMGKKSESTVGTDGRYVISNRKVTEEEFKKRHQQIKDLHNNISSMRSDLDMKMANLLDKSKGPLPEAQNKYNFENYATIGWSILATSILYYTFVEMK